MVGDTRKPMITAGTAERIGPKYGTISRSPAKRESTNAYLTSRSLRPRYVRAKIEAMRANCPSNHAPNRFWTWVTTLAMRIWEDDGVKDFTKSFMAFCSMTK